MLNQSKNTFWWNILTKIKTSEHMNRVYFNNQLFFSNTYQLITHKYSYFILIKLHLTGSNTHRSVAISLSVLKTIKSHPIYTVRIGTILFCFFPCVSWLSELTTDCSHERRLWNREGMCSTILRNRRFTFVIFHNYFTPTIIREGVIVVQHQLCYLMARTS